eukprot:jgi/Ulvmu1/7435/UM036_0096.1
MPPKRLHQGGHTGLPDADLIEAAFMALSHGADDADAKVIFNFFETVHPSTYRLQSVRRAIRSSNWGYVDRAGFRVALAAFLAATPDPSLDSIQPPLLRFKLIDALRKVVRSCALTKFFRRDLATKEGAALYEPMPGGARSKVCAGPGAQKMALVLHNVQKSRGRHQLPHHAPGHRSPQEKKQEYVQRLSQLAPPMRCAAARRVSAACGVTDPDLAAPSDSSSPGIADQRCSIGTELQRLFPSALLTPEHPDQGVIHHHGLGGHNSHSAKCGVADPTVQAAGGSVVPLDHSQGWAALQDILTLPETASGGLPAGWHSPAGPVQLRSAGSMFDELIDTPCGHSRGYGDLPLSLMHSRHSDSGSEGRLTDAGVALELGAARGPSRGRHLDVSLRRSGKKTLRIREPHSAAGGDPGPCGGAASPEKGMKGTAILKRASAAAKGAHCVTLLNSRQRPALSAAAMAAEQATIRLRKEYFATIPLEVLQPQTHPCLHHAFATTGRHTAPERQRPRSRATESTARPAAAHPTWRCQSNHVGPASFSRLATVPGPHGSRPTPRMQFGPSPPRTAPAAPTAALAACVRLDSRGDFPAVLAAARDVPGTPPRAVATAAELRQVPLDRRYRLLQLRMAARYREQAWSVLGPLAQDGGGRAHVRGLQAARDEGRVARVVRGQHEAHYLTCVP